MTFFSLTFKGNRTVLEDICDYDPKRMNSQIRRDVEAVVEKHKNSFEKAVIYRASAAAGPMADWVLAVLSFS